MVENVRLSNMTLHLCFAVLPSLLLLFKSFIFQQDLLTLVCLFFPDGWMIICCSIFLTPPFLKRHFLHWFTCKYPNPRHSSANYNLNHGEMILTVSISTIKINFFKQRYFTSGQGWSEIQVENLVHVNHLLFCSLLLQLFVCRFRVLIDSCILEKVLKF